MPTTDELDPVLFPPKPAGGTEPGLPAVLAPTPLMDAVRAQFAQQDDGLQVGVVLADGKPQAQAQGKKTWDSGWSVSGAVSWAKEKGLAAAAFVGWSPKSKGGG
jgi:hypothetical protein